MHNFRELAIWQQSIQLVKDVYVLSSQFPESEKFGITAQIRRAVVSIPSNIAEGSGRNTDTDFSRFLAISLGSAYEVESLLVVAVSLDFVSESEMNCVLEELTRIQKMLKSFKYKLKNTLEEPVESYSLKP